ncbi:hypothetical protein [Ectobacillus ponti]|uniref:Conjugal transfer protein n=1 Tax=Ectobacillus ponti TaxID=2961894 RepID=A0AA42BQY7_9BACI|nr:hypothetical protein [Ectobacillus ponti]MCP8968949.1 hypothetical protein [Ectobacillus ponti]
MWSSWKAKREERKRRRQEKAVQDLIPVRALDGGIVVTDDFRLVQLLRVSSLNLDLMSHRELQEVMEKYELFLRSLSFPVQTAIMSQPVDLGGYIRGLEEKQASMPDVKRDLLNGYLAYARAIETSTSMIQRQRYLVFMEAILGTTRQAYETAMQQLEQKRKYVKSGLEEMGLEAREASGLDVARYLHTLFDYTGSQYRPVEDDLVPCLTRREGI